MNRPRLPSLFLIAAAALAAAGTAHAQAAWPAKQPITWVVPFTPGGITDTTSRTVTKKMGELLGQTFVVENRPGAGGSLGTEQVARAPADGYTVLYATSGTMAANLALYKNLKYDPLKDFVPVHGMFLSPNVLVVDAAKPFKTVAELVQWGKANPAKLNYGSAGPGTGTHLSAELFADQAGIRMTHVPYKGSTPALQDLLGGRLDAMFDYPSIVLPHVKAGKLRALAVLADKRLDALPDVPTIAEAGFPGAVSSAWSGIVVPAGTPPEVVKKLAGAMSATLNDKEIAASFLANGSQPMSTLGEAAFRRFIAEEQKKWAEVVRKSGAKLE
jgi:tripartite-type tricarboxylate transporter receptor subunit TctC